MMWLIGMFFGLQVVFAQDSDLNAETGTAPQTGSLWMDSRSRMLVGMEGKTRDKGDLITVTISERTSTSLTAGTKTSRDSEVSTGISSIFGLEQKLLNLYPELGGEISMAATSGSNFLGDGSTSREGQLTGVVTCEVVNVLQNGNLVILGWKEVRSNKETQYLSLSGVVRPQDIKSNNTIASDLVAEARIEYTGAGVVADKQSPGFGVRVIDHVWPF